jgi:DNA-binding NarL/FixJ family response regulator
LRVLLADDHGIVRRGLRSLIETQPDLKVVAEAGDGLEALKLCEEHRPRNDRLEGHIRLTLTFWTT